MKGYVLEKRGSYGFISTDQGEEFFFHKEQLKNCTFRQLEEGDPVEFEIEPGLVQEGKHKTALEIRKMNQATPEAVAVGPGHHPSLHLHLDHFIEDEKKIVMFLEKVFYVSNGGEEFTINDNRYRYCLIKPTDYFNRSFHLNREIVVVFSDYVNFEPRCLDVIDAVYNRVDSKLRLDRGCHIFVCHDDHLEEKLAKILKGSNYNEIMIPFTYRELLSDQASENMVKDRFRKYLFDADLFSAFMPIRKDIFFFGRRDFAHDIASKCKRNEHCGVFGLRRSGKTSLLYAVQNMLEDQFHPTVFIPCESLQSLDWRTALCKVVRDIYQRLDYDSSHISAEDYRTDTTLYFEEDLYECLKDYPVPVTVMFDEIEQITFSVPKGEVNEYGESVDDAWLDGRNYYYFWNAIKGYYTKHPRHLSILVAGTNPMINEESTVGLFGKQNPMFMQLSQSNQGAYLQAFSTEDTKNMVNTLGGYMGLSFDDYSVNKLTMDCGGHPYLMRILCAHINKYMRTQGIERPAVISRAIYDKASPLFEQSNEARSFFIMILDILMKSYLTEYNALKHLALNGDSVVSQIVDKDSLPHLIGYGLVDANGDHYAIKYDSILRYLQGRYQFERQGLTIEEQKEEIDYRMDKSEIQLRTVVKNTLRFAFGKSGAHARVIASMRASRQKNTVVQAAETLEYDQLFDTSVNQMYFSLLKMIILRNFSAFANVFEGCGQDEIRENLDTLNLSRRCPAHHFDKNAERWSWEDFEKFRESMSWLETILKGFE